jgi:hypothetical protein
VAANIWQIFFWLDVRRAFLAADEAGDLRMRFLDLYERRLERICHTSCAATATALAVKLWFRFMLMKHRPPGHRAGRPPS